MRIGINASFLRKPGTGIGQVTSSFIAELAKLSGSGEPKRFVLYTEEPIDLKLPETFEVKSFLPWWKRDDLLRKRLWERQVAHEAQRDGCDVFLSLYQSSTIVPKGMKHVMVVHDIIPRLFPEYQGNMRKRWYWSAVERGIDRASRLVAISQATRNDLVEWGIASEKITRAYPDAAPRYMETLTPEQENRVMAEYGLVPGYIYHGGGLEIRKNAGNLLRAYALLIHNETSGIAVPPLVISGKVFPESNPLATPAKRLVRELGLEKRVRLLDFVPEGDLPALYKNALFFAYPSLYEGFGLPVLEALRMKTPVLTSDASSLPEVAGDAALYIDPRSVESIASGMERLLRDAALRQALSAAAPKEAARFSWSFFTETVLHTLED